MGDVTFLYGRPGPHPLHGFFANSVGATRLPLDFALRYYDRGSSRPRRYLSWVLSAALLPLHASGRLILSDGAQVPPALLRWTPLLGRRWRVVALMANETLYFLETGRYSRWTSLWTRLVLRSYDALLCVGTFQTELAQRQIGGRRPRILTIRSAIAHDRLGKLSIVVPNLDSHHVVCVANAPGGWRTWYKGIDLLIGAVESVHASVPGITLTLVGDVTLQRMPGSTVPITLAGPQTDLGPFFSEAALYVHLGRGDAWPVSVLEAMAAGLPALVTTTTGTREAAGDVDGQLVVPPTITDAAEAITWYFSLSPSERSQLSQRARTVALKYTEERASRTIQEALACLSPPLKPRIL
jgi:glycosyltransferase involved in cell wall biosynthesis